MIIYPRKYTQILTTWFMHAYIGHIFLFGPSHSITSTWFLSVVITLQLNSFEIFLVNSSLICPVTSCFFCQSVSNLDRTFCIHRNSYILKFLWNDIKYNASLGVGVLMSEKNLPLLSVQIDFHFHLYSILFGAYMKGFQY